MSWVETTSPSFTARHEERDERRRRVGPRAARGHPRAPRRRLPRRCPPRSPSCCTRRCPRWPSPNRRCRSCGCSPRRPGRRYLAGWISAREVHVLAPRLLAARASSVRGSREMLMLTPAALYAQLVVAANNPRLPPPFTPGRFARLRALGLARGRRGAVLLRADGVRAPGDRAAPARGPFAALPADRRRRLAARRQRVRPAGERARRRGGGRARGVAALRRARARPCVTRSPAAH